MIFSQDLNYNVTLFKQKLDFFVRMINCDCFDRILHCRMKITKIIVIMKHLVQNLILLNFGRRSHCDKNDTLFSVKTLVSIIIRKHTKLPS